MVLEWVRRNTRSEGPEHLDVLGYVLTRAEERQLVADRHASADASDPCGFQGHRASALALKH
jgi:hypothetical protein